MPSALASFIQKPQELSSIFFETQRRDEKIILLTRRHLITNARWISILLIGVAIPALFFLLEKPIAALLGFPQLITLLTLYQWFVAIFIYYIFLAYYGFLNLLEWFFTVLIVSNHRVLDINFIPPFNRQSTQAQLEEVQDVRENQHGVFGVLFNYGDIFIQTAGTKQNISLNRIPKPNTVHNVIIQLLTKRSSP